MLKNRAFKRGAPKKTPIEPQGKVLFVMNRGTFVEIPSEYRNWIYAQYKNRSIPRPAPDIKLENIFYQSLAQKEITSIAKWTQFINSGEAALADTDPDYVVKLLGIPFRGREYLQVLLQCEFQRWLEMYYVDQIMKHGKCDMNYPCADPDIAEQIITKYNLIEFPCSLVPVTKPVPVPTTLTKKKPGSRPGEPKVKLTDEKITYIRKNLMKCRAPVDISHELKTSPQTIYNAISNNMFVSERTLKKTLPQHVENVMRLISKGDTSWEYYVTLHGICEKALMRALNAKDYHFIYEFRITPTKDSLVFEYNQNKGNVKKTALEFDVPIETMQRWLLSYGIGAPVTIKGKTTSPRRDREIAIVENGGVIEKKYMLGGREQRSGKFDRDLLV